MACSGKVKPSSSNSFEAPPSHFFKVILPTSLADKKLRIPEMFVKKFGNELSDVAKLTVPNGRVWQVGLTKDGRKIWLQDGWHDFVQCHSICVGYFLVFKYAKNSAFDVLIFDLSACEIHYPCNGGIPGTDEKNTVHQDEMENKPLSSSENSKLKDSHEPQSKKCKMEELEEINVSNDRNEYGLFAVLKEMGIYISERFGVRSEEEIGRAINIARSLRPKNPSLMVILRSANLPPHSLVYVPAKFSDKYLSGDCKMITLQASNGREWPVKLSRKSARSVRIATGWARFNKDNNLKEGDICLFELIRMEDIILKVSVFCATIE